MSARQSRKSRVIFATPVVVSGLCGLASAGLSSTALAQADSGSVDEITVTARKREENIQDIPVAVSAVSATQIEELNITGLSEISKLTAGLVFDNEFGRGSDRPVIRGQANILGDSGVAYFIDGVYINGSIADYDLNDVERIEVVKGPQSALYGRNTYSGAINIISKSPGDELSADLRYMRIFAPPFTQTTSMSLPRMAMRSSRIFAPSFTIG